MKLRLVILATIALALSCGIYVASAQQSDEEVRGYFLDSRPKTTNRILRRVAVINRREIPIRRAVKVKHRAQYKHRRR